MLLNLLMKFKEVVLSVIKAHGKKVLMMVLIYFLIQAAGIGGIIPNLALNISAVPTAIPTPV